MFSHVTGFGSSLGGSAESRQREWCPGNRIDGMGWKSKSWKRWKKDEKRKSFGYTMIFAGSILTGLSLLRGVILLFGGGDVRIWTFRYLSDFWIHHSWAVGPLYNVHKGPVTWPWKHSRQHHKLNEITQWILLWIPSVFWCRISMFCSLINSFSSRVLKNQLVIGSV